MIFFPLAIKVSEFNTLYNGKCLKIWVDELLKENMGQIGLDIGLQMPDGANVSGKVYFNHEESATNVILGHPVAESDVFTPQMTKFFQLRYWSCYLHIIVTILEGGEGV